LNEHPAFLRRSGVRQTVSGLAIALTVMACVATLLQAQISDADKKKRDAFLKAREEMRTVPSSTPSNSPTPSGKPKPATKKGKGGKTPTPSPSPKKKKGAVDDDDEDSTPSTSKGKKDGSPSPKATATPKKSEDSEPETTPRAITTPRASVEPVEQPPLPRPAATPPIVVPTAPLPADITIEKSGLEQEQGFEPPPPPPPQRGFFARLFGGGQRNYRYLNRATIEAIRRAPVQRSRWKFIIVHNSGTRQGNAKAFDYYHKRVKRMQNGMAYHFVVGNGRSSGDGEIEIGDRWRRQINGGHVHSDYLNNISLGICFVGDFNRDQPTRAQLEAAEELIKYLRDRCGKVDGRAIGVRPHREMNPPRWATDCPGDAFPYGWFRRF